MKNDVDLLSLSDIASIINNVFVYILYFRVHERIHEATVQCGVFSIFVFHVVIQSN